MRTEQMTAKLIRKEKRRKLLPMVVTWLIVFGIYCGLLLIEGLFVGGDIYVSIVTFIAGSGLLAGLAVMLIVFPHKFYLPLAISIATQLVFIFIGSYLEELEFYFFVMLMVVGIVSTVKNFKLLAWCVSLMTVINILMLALYAPRLEWLYHYRFFMSFVLFLYGSAFMLIQTYNVAVREGRANRGLAAFSSFLYNTPNYMIITDSSNRVRYISEEMLKFANFSKQEYAQGQPLIDLFPSKALKLMFAQILESEGLHETIIETDIDGADKYFRVVTGKLSDTSGDRFIDVADITEMEKSRLAAEIARSTAETASVKLQEALEKAEEATRSKTNFLATMSHEIRTPMNAILGITQIQMQSAHLPKEYMEELEKIHNAGNNLLGIINDILDMSKIETGKMELNAAEYDVPSLINDAVQLNIVRIGSKELEFFLEVDENLPTKLFGDELRLKQILNNLLSNAIKYTGKGYVKLSVSHTVKDEIFTLRFAIEDTGQGMKPDDLEKLFSEYSRFNSEANRDTEGTGLGLNITKKLVEMMDGTVTAESEYGKGSVFTIEVKQGEVNCDVIGTKLAKQLCNFTFRGDKQFDNLQIIRDIMPYGKVLIVDDVETNLYVAKGLMAPYLLNIETALSGFSAIEMLKSGNVYDIIFMDHMMPKMDGIEATKKIREAGYSKPVVALTANAVAGQAEVFLENGFDGFISKPIDLRQLDAALNKYIRDKQPPEVLEAVKQQQGLIENQPKTSKNNQSADAELLAIFVKDAKKSTEIIESVYKGIESAADDDLRLYVINVHAMKSALANIGEHEAAKTADLLEQAGKKQNKAAIVQETPHFLGALQAIISKNDIAEDNEADTDSDPAFLREQFALIAAACDDYDDIAAEEALAKLKQKAWSKETKKLLTAITECILHSEFEEARELLSNTYTEIH